MHEEVPIFEADTEIEITMRRKIFEVESARLDYAQALGTCQNDPRVKTRSHTSVVDMACHFLHVGWPWAEVSSAVDYKAMSLIPYSYRDIRMK